MINRDTVVCIATYKRPAGLQRCLESIGLLETDRLLRVIVADNDGGDAAGLSVCESLRTSGYPYAIASLKVTERGISHARNALVREAIADPDVKFIAMIDDDEWPDEGWLQSLLDVQANTGADVVGGPVTRVFARPVPEYLARANLADFSTLKSGAVEFVDGTCNVLIKADTFRAKQAPWFDPAFGLLGGEDTDFFVGLKVQGSRFAWAETALVYEEMPASRSSARWMLQRAYRIGNTYSLVNLKHRPPGFGIRSETVKILGTVAVSAATIALCFWHPARRFEATRLLARAMGKVAGFLGRRHAEYTVVHGG